MQQPHLPGFIGQCLQVLHAVRVIALILLIFAREVSAQVDLVKVDKSENRLYLMQGEKVIKAFHAAFGGNPRGHKQQEGDERTPEGRYTLDYIKEDSAFYRAMHISYPNDNDKARAKANSVDPGGFIMVHGQKNGAEGLTAETQRSNWTAGCIALTNPEMDEFLDLVKVGTAIHIEW